MFKREIYMQRRRQLMRQMKNGLILLLGHVDAPFNALDNCYRFRQDSSFLYFCGLDQPGLAAVLDVDSGEELLFGSEAGLEEIIWSGPMLSLAKKGARVGMTQSRSFEQLETLIAQASQAGRKIHFLPTCRAENLITMAHLTGLAVKAVADSTSQALVRAVVALRSIKEEEEIQELDDAAELGCQLHQVAMEMATPGVYEWEIVGALEAVAAQAGRMLAFPPIVTLHGEILHNHQRDNLLADGDMLLVDAGVESSLHYASDHTRTVPVGGDFTPRQRDIYKVVMQGLERAKELICPGVTYLDVHLDVCRTLVGGLKNLDLMAGDTEQAVAAGAHALFMPHGLGHMLGLDVHDMEDLGEDYVGYDEQVKRSDQFGTARLRLGRELQQNFALTVEPGIYFIPTLIEQWKSCGRHQEFINYPLLEEYLDFGGIRLEDDILVTANGNRLLGSAIPLK